MITYVSLLFPDPFRGKKAWQKTMEPQKPGPFPRPGSEVAVTESHQRASGAKSLQPDSAEFDERCPALDGCRCCMKDSGFSQF